MKLFQKLLVAPAALGLLVPFSASANEFNINGISEYSFESEEYIDDEFNSDSFSSDLAKTNSSINQAPISGSTFEAGSFSETTVASFTADMLIGGASGDAATMVDPEAIGAFYSFEVGLDTSFTGEDNLAVVMGAGNTAAGIPVTTTLDFGNANSDALKVKDVNYTRTIGDKFTFTVGDSLDVSKNYTGACAYSGFTDILADCGTSNSAGLGGDVTLSTSYDIGNGFTLGAGISGSEGSTTDGIFTKEGNDMYGLQLAYGADTYGVAVSYSDVDVATNDVTYWGINAYYSFDNDLLSSISVGYETGDPEVGEDAKAYFVGLTSQEVGPGAISFAMGTAHDVNLNSLILETAEMTYLYELSYGWSINDATTATVGGFIQERQSVNGDDLQGLVFKTSFAF